MLAHSGMPILLNKTDRIPLLHKHTQQKDNLKVFRFRKKQSDKQSLPLIPDSAVQAGFKNARLRTNLAHAFRVSRLFTVLQAAFSRTQNDRSQLRGNHSTIIITYPISGCERFKIRNKIRRTIAPCCFHYEWRM